MAKKQTRRTVSFNRAVHTVLSREANIAGVSIARFVTDRLRAGGLDLPAVTHLTTADVMKMREARARGVLKRKGTSP
jgi:hypothetical protein